MITLPREIIAKASAAAAATLAVIVSCDAAPLNLQNVPLYLTTAVNPNVLINMSVETPMGGAAYNDNVGTPTGCPGRATVSGNGDMGTCYFPATTYIGYFNARICYTYSTSNNRFEPSSTAASDHSCTSKWSGNFLNWASMTAIDMFIMTMTGGNRIVDTAGLTVIRRARKQNDNSWFPIKVLDASLNAAPSSVTPYGNSTLYIYNTDWGLQLGASFSAATGSAPTYGPFNVDLKACDSLVESATLLPTNCFPYGSSTVYYKPEGLIQKNAWGRRFALTSYTLDNAQTRNGGVLRSNMKYVGPTLPDGSDNTAKEFGADGIFINNPDGATGGLNSGVINYINQFSTPGYKSYDPIAELFYEGIRYFKHEGPTPEYSSGLTTAQYGSFQIVTNWNDPIQYRCQKNFIVAINDANPWLDKTLPGTYFTFPTLYGASWVPYTLTANDYGEPSNADHDIDVRQLTNTVGQIEGLNATFWPSTGTWTSGSASGFNDSVGGGFLSFDNSCTGKWVGALGEVMGTCPYPPKQNSYYIAGLAYYANTHDLRPDMPNDRGIQRIESYFIDTQEYNTNPLDGPKNMLWLAGKYGGFDDTRGDGTPGTIGDGIPQQPEWDANNDGVPDNYILATQPQNLVIGLNQAFDNIDTKTSTASSASVNSGSISNNTRIYQARFNSGSWTGQLLSYRINMTDGSLGSLDWDAAAVVPPFGSRKIVTVNGSGMPIAFTWASLDATRKSQLDLSAALAQSKLNYLRGDAGNEGKAAANFRVRATKLGDIINSSPIFVAAPAFDYSDSLESAAYSSFRSAKQTRQPMLYIGANDGMLHAFSATDGVEKFAFIPSTVFGNLSLLSNRNYTHHYFVDGTAQAGDVFYGGAWHTVLVGGLAKGGQGIYALDITDPSAFANAEISPATIVKWEFTDANDADLGYTFSRPQIVRLHNGKWAAIFGNGYNSTESDGHVSTTGAAVLFIVDISSGALIRKITTGVGSTTTPNGLATPALVDLDGDAIADFAYAGDLRGNMWKFDLRDVDPANWKVAFADAGANPLPFFSANDGVTPTPNAQPITQRPIVIRGPNSVGMAVLFGTGKYLEPIDESATPQLVQTIYGVYDANSGTNADIVSGRSALQQQTITNELLNQSFGSQTYNLRVTSSNAIASGKHGWYLDLLSPSGYQAEKSVADSIVRNGRIIFTTAIPNMDPCAFGGTGWIMELDALTGSRLTQSPFDLNSDRTFDTSDWVTLPDGTTVPATGMQSTEGLLPTPGIAADKDIEYKYTPGTSGNIQITKENPGRNGHGRQSWRQVR